MTITAVYVPKFETMMLVKLSWSFFYDSYYDYKNQNCITLGFVWEGEGKVLEGEKSREKLRNVSHFLKEYFLRD